MVARELGLSYSTAHRILGVLTDSKLLRYDPLGRQFSLAAGVLRLSAGYQESMFVEHAALPRMRAWTRKHGWPLLLIRSEEGGLVIRASTDAERPIDTVRCVTGARLPVKGGSEAAISAAFGVRRANTSEARKVRRHGYALSAAAEGQVLHVSVPVMIDAALAACLSMRCLPIVAESRGNLVSHVDSLTSLATEIAACARPFGPAG